MTALDSFAIGSCGGLCAAAQNVSPMTDAAMALRQYHLELTCAAHVADSGGATGY